MTMCYRRCWYEDHHGECRAPRPNGRYPADAHCVMDRLDDDEEDRKTIQQRIRKGKRRS